MLLFWGVNFEKMESMMNSAQQELLDRMKTTDDKTEYMKLQAINLFKMEKMEAGAVAKIVNKSVEIIYQWAHRYKKFGIEGLVNKPRGGRKWSYLSLEEEENLLEELRKDATKGLVVVTKIVRKKAEEKLGKPVSADYAEDLLNRHNWRKIMPRPKHPKSTKEEQEKFKKKYLNSSNKL